MTGVFSECKRAFSSSLCSVSVLKENSCDTLVKIRLKYHKHISTNAKQTTSLLLQAPVQVQLKMHLNS